MNAKTLKNKGLKVILAATVVGAGAYSFVPHSLADTTTEIKGDQNTSANGLSNIQIEGFQLDHAFSADVLDYSATVGKDVKNIILHLKANNDDSVITINRETVEDPANVSLNVETGNHLFLIVVNDGVHTPVTYTLKIIKEPSKNNLLKDIKLSKGKLSKTFDSSVADYNVLVTSEIGSLTVTPEVFEATESVKINGTQMNNDGVTVKLPVDKTDIIIEVTAENGDIKKYILHVTREDKVSPGEPIKKPASPQKGSPTNNNSAANSGQKYTGTFTNNVKGTQSNGTRSAQSGSTQSNGKKSTQSGSTQSQAQLSSLSVSEGTWNKTFSRDEYTYHIAVGSSVKSVNIDAIARTSGAAVSIEGGDNSIKLGDYAKKTIISIIVEKDDERKTYVLVFDKNVKAKKASESSTVVTNTSSSDSTVNTVQTNNTTVTNHIQYANQNQTKQSTSWWARLWSSIKGWF